jgi:hypothetical protein
MSSNNTNLRDRPWEVEEFFGWSTSGIYPSIYLSSIYLFINLTLYI